MIITKHIIKFSVRRYSSYKDADAVNLSYIKATPQVLKSNTPLLILHGLFGSKQNWKSLSKLFANKLNAPVYALDLRNHGESPHTNEMSLPLMAQDLALFCKTHNLKSLNLLGHSLGARVAMHFALSPLAQSTNLEKLVVSDMSPTSTLRKSLDIEDKIYAMEELLKHEIENKTQAKQILYHYLKEKAMADFLVTNLIIYDNSRSASWRVNLPTIKKSLDSFWEFPYEGSGKVFTNPSLFVGATKAKYLLPKHIDLVKTYFPNAEIEFMETGHWIHAEKPKEFVDLVNNFLN